MLNRLLFIFLFFIINSSLYAQLSKVHYLPPVAYSGNSNGAASGPYRGEYIYISTPSVNPVSVNVKEVGGATINYVVTNANPQTHIIRPPEDPYLGGLVDSSRFSIFSESTDAATTTSIINSDKGYIIDATEPVYVGVRIYNRVHGAALVSKGSAALGNTFRTGSFTNYNPDFSQLNFLSVMATEDVTEVIINNIDQDVDILDFDEELVGNNPDGNLNDIIVVLNRGESYIVALKSAEGEPENVANYPNRSANGDGIIGALVSSDKPVVVNSGSLAGGFHDNQPFGRDLGIDQIVPIEKVGDEYIFIRGVGGDSFENVLIVAHEDNTQVFVNGNAVASTNSETGNDFLNAGEYILLEGNNYTSDNNMYVQTSKPVYAYQGIAGANSVANQAIFFVPPLKCSSTGDVNNIPEIDKIGTYNFTGKLNIVSKVGATITITDLNNTNESINSLNIATKSGPFAVEGNASYETYIISGLKDNVSVFSNDELYINYFNKNGFATSGGFYSGFTAPPETPQLNLNLAGLGYCIPNVTLETGDMSVYTSYEWQFDSGSGFNDIVGATNQANYVPANPGLYRVKAFFVCPGKPVETLFSPSISISKCPPDFDSDGIIDNIDQDIDNDGITNVIDSKGLATLDLTNINNPVVVFNDSSTDSSVITSTFEQTSLSGPNTFSGASSGLFTSTVNIGTNQKAIYTAASNFPLNLYFTYDLLHSHSINSGESYIIKVNDFNRTITLTDSNNQLLVDANFDGNYTAVSSLTLNEIRFKFNPAPAGVLPFNFSANGIDGFVFTHELSNNSSNSIFNGYFTLSSYNLDTDSDGSFDSFDLDSDNDGCSDTLESGYTDPDGDSILGTSAVSVDSFGLVLGQGGYVPLPLDIDTTGVRDFQEFLTAPEITSQPQDGSACLGSDGLFAVSTNSSNTSYQWQSVPSLSATLALTARLSKPSDVWIDSNNTIYVADKLNHRIRKISSAGVVTTFAGTGSTGSQDGIGSVAQFNVPNGVISDSNGNVYVADYISHKIRKISPLGVVSTLAGNGNPGHLDGTGTLAQFNGPYRIAIDSNGDLFVTDRENDRIRKITPAGVVTTFAGGLNGDLDGTGIAARFSRPLGIAIDSNDNLFITDLINNKIKKITPGGVVTTFAGDGTAAQFNSPHGIDIDSNDNLFIADAYNDRIIKITPAGVKTTFAGDGTQGSLDGTGIAAQFNRPYGITIDTNNNLYVADHENSLIRKITPAGVVTTFAGSTQGYLDTTPIVWTDLATNTIYNGVTTSQLNVVSPTLDVSGTNYRVLVRKLGLSCPVISTPAQLDIGEGSIVVSSTSYEIAEGSTVTTELPILLNAKPPSEVVFDISNPDLTELILVSSSTIVFTPDNWNIPQNIILAGVYDNLEDGDVNVPLNFSINDGLSADCFDSNPDTTITVKVLDINCTASIVAPSSPVLENSGTSTFSLVLDASPSLSSSVVMDISSSNTETMNVNPSRVIFTAANWNVPQIINYEPVNNDILDGSRQASITIDINDSLTDNCYKTLTSIFFNITINDDEVAGYTVSGVQGSLLEASSKSASFTVVLDVKPISDVYVNIDVQDSTEVIANTDELIFTPDDWNIPQIVFLSDADEFIIDGDKNSQIITSIKPTSSDGFPGLPNQTVSVLTQDNDVSGIILSTIDNLTDENGDTGSFGIKLATQPSSSVTIFISSSNTGEGTVQGTVVFNSTNWDTIQVITVTGMDDDPPVSDGAIDYKINMDSITTLDADYNGLDLSLYDGMPFVNQDNDAPGIFVTILNEDFNTDEYGDTVTIQFELLAQPNLGSDVTIPLSIIGATDEVELIETSITIKNENWNNKSLNQILITGLDDNVIDGDQKVTLVTGDPASGDPTYNSLSANSVADIDFINKDNDQAGINLSIPDVVSEDLISTKIDVSLSTEVLSDVIINLTVSDNSELSINVSKLTFTSLNENILQTVIITGVDDLLFDGSIASEIIFTIDPIFSEHAYSILDPIEVVVINEDNEKDQDLDEIIDKLDNCVSIANTDQIDMDNDGIGDVCDDDIDGDGVLNQVEISDNTDEFNPCSFLAIHITLPVSNEIDCDSDGIPDHIDLDDDNDGISDIQESQIDTDNDGFNNSVDLDSDNDGCSDVLEAGFLDPNTDGILGEDDPTVVDIKGLVLNNEGYKTPLDRDSNGIYDYLEIGGPVSIIIQPLPKYEITGNQIISIEVQASSLGQMQYQWQVNKQGLFSKGFQWVDITDDNTYKGAETSILNISNATDQMNGWKYRVIVRSDCYVCSDQVISNESELFVQPFFIPNAFSPDGDGVNDYWVIDGIFRFPSNRIRVYNRWEEKVFEATNYQNDWNGISNISSFAGKLPEGTYFYILELGGNTKPFKGFVYIKRRVR